MDRFYWETKKNSVLDLSPIDIANGLNKGLTKLTDEEIEAFLNPSKTEEELEKIRIDEINAKARSIIYSKYPQEKQSSAQLGIYGDEYLATMKAFIRQVIDISNKAIDDKIPAKDVDWAGLDK